MSLGDRLASRAAVAADILRRPDGVRQLYTAAAHSLAPARFDDLPLPVAVRLAYNVVLRREPRPEEAATALERLRSGELTQELLVHELVASIPFDQLPLAAAVRWAYEVVLRREPKAEEAAAAIEQLHRGAIRHPQFLDALQGSVPLTDYTLPVLVQLAYRMMLRREPDPEGEATAIELLEGDFDAFDFLDWLVSSREFQSIRFRAMGPSLHASRSQFVRSLPRARRILDLGGTSLGDPEGAMVVMGYPYAFEELVIVDLPQDDRHPLYQRAEVRETVQTALGPVRYEYHSMADLSRYADESFDLVYSGQTFEHVTEAEGDTVLAGVHRVLVPGGFFALDTPNGPACRVRQDEFIDPDHKIEYSREQLEEKLAKAGLEIRGAWGLNYVGPSIASGQFSDRECAGNPGMFAVPDDCYLLAYLCQKPAAR